MRRGVVIVISIMALLLAGGASFAEDWQWPATMKVGGFDINTIKGTAKPDGSGTAEGNLVIPALGDQAVSLTRATNGDITGTVVMSKKYAGADVQANLNLSQKGLDGKGTVSVGPKQIGDAVVTISPTGQVTGNGKISFGGLSLTAKFTVNGNMVDLSGSASVQKQADTPLAVYTFDGNVNLKSNQGKFNVLANGEVQRTGKLSNQVSKQVVTDIPVNIADGQATINISGVSVTFKLF